MKRRCAGMTLLELLVALAVFTLIAGAAYGGLREAVRTQQRLDTQRDFWLRLERVHRVLADDLAGVRTAAPTEPATASFRAESPRGEIESGGWLSFVRDTDASFRDGPVTPWRAISYARDGEVLRRAIDPDPAQQSIIPEPLLTGITALRARYLDRENRWADAWPPAGVDAAGADAPRAIELKLTLAGHGEFTWLFHVGLAP